VAPSLERLVERVAPAPTVRIREPRRVLIAGHDLKFATRLIEHVASLPDVELRQDKWRNIHESADPEATERLTEWADVILAEWCMGNAKWFSERVRPGQRLAVRFHLVERTTEFPDTLNFDNVHHVAFVGPHIMREMAPRMVPMTDRLSVVPNVVPDAHLRRPKLPGSRYTLGLVGASPWRKRLDWAVEIVRLLRLRDDRFSLSVKGHLPTDYAWVWRRAEERARYLGLAHRIANDPVLSDAVTFDGFDNDVPEWYRKIGFILSVSDFESYHLGCAEGIGAGCVPVIRDWEGAAELYPDEELISSPEEAAAFVLRMADSGVPERRAAAALEEPGDAQAVATCRKWERILFEPIA
jgi:glycosyltransferase involved in cell wall biosynthesis